MLLGLATCRNLPAHEADDRHLHAALRARGLAFEQPVWNDPAVDWGRYDAVLVRTTWDYQEHLPEFRAFAAAVGARTRLDNPPAVLHWNTHKFYLRELAARGVPIADTEWLPRGGAVDLGAWAKARGYREGFLKPAVGATARETLRFATDAAGLRLAAAHVQRLLPHEDLLLQPFLPEVLTRGEWSAVFVDGAIVQCVRKIPVPGDYRVQDDFGARDEPYEPLPDERRLAVAAMAAACGPGGAVPGASGQPLLYGRADFLWGDAGPVLTELELVEPSLFFRHAPHTAELLVAAWLRRLG
ncbi:MAG: hypothetical protein JNK49_00730 [Planctomycetes bacterium]|nr:hypothetical protein [Planctomycetota bacterium]